MSSPTTDRLLLNKEKVPHLARLREGKAGATGARGFNYENRRRPAKIDTRRRGPAAPGSRFCHTITDL